MSPMSEEQSHIAKVKYDLFRDLISTVSQEVKLSVIKNHLTDFTI